MVIQQNGSLNAWQWSPVELSWALIARGHVLDVLAINQLFPGILPLSQCAAPLNKRSILSGACTHRLVVWTERLSLRTDNITDNKAAAADTFTVATSLSSIANLLVADPTVTAVEPDIILRGSLDQAPETPSFFIGFELRYQVKC
jgi:hypothetical protein